MKLKTKRQSIITHQQPLLSWEANLPITEQSNEVLPVFPQKISLIPVPGASREADLSIAEKPTEVLDALLPTSRLPVPGASWKVDLSITEQSTEVLDTLALTPPFIPVPGASWKVDLSITEQSTEVLDTLALTPPFIPVPEYSDKRVMRFGKKTLFSFLLGFDLLANILELTHINFLYTTTLISFCTCILLPGFLISLILRIRKISFWENIVLIVGLSLAFLEFGGLLLNVLLPFFRIKNPLAFQNLVIGFDIYVLLLFIFAWVSTKQLMFQICIPRYSNIEKVFYIVPVFLPTLATLGAIVLNNGGSNVLTLILLVTIAFYVLLLVLFHNKVKVDLYPYAIFFIGIACLFITSLRSWYISGHDIEREFYVFQLTNAHHIWNMAFYQDAYNACLSITILPTILTNLLFIQDMYIYKVIFQILFATSPVLIFFIISNYATPILAFLSAFIFVTFPTFFTDMPMLNRQEIGLIFFGLALYLMLKRNRARQFYPKFALLPPSEVSLTMRRILFIIFALCVVVSHYSTNFVLFALIAAVYPIMLIISKRFSKNTFALLMTKSKIKLKNTFSNKMFLSLPIVLTLLGMTFFWYSIYTHTSGNFGSVFSRVVTSILVASNGDSRSGELSYSIFFAPKLDQQQQLQEYIQNIVQTAKESHPKNTNQSIFFSKSTTDKYPIFLRPQEQLPSTPLGSILSSIQIPVFNIQSDLKYACAFLMQIFVFIGLSSMVLRRNNKSWDVQYLLLCISAVFLLALITVLPMLSLNYGVLRMFQQCLFILSLPIVFGINSIFFFVKEQKRILFTATIIAFLFLNLTGFVSHLTGEYYPQMWLDNSGLYYDAYYIHKSDVIAIVWLSENNVNHDPVEADLSNTNIMLPYGNINALDGILPQVTRKDAYVFLQTSSNRVVLGQTVLIYNSPQSFLRDNKNLVYSNGQDNIFK